MAGRSFSTIIGGNEGDSSTRPKPIARASEIVSFVGERSKLATSSPWWGIRVKSSSSSASSSSGTTIMIVASDAASSSVASSPDRAEQCESSSTASIMTISEPADSSSSSAFEKCSVGNLSSSVKASNGVSSSTFTKTIA
ncbi:hypothetical protein MJO29_008314 [Puccinia striiformis f. sp. tritici]|nr:hypothetical protein MJO29_008314 [Puccinia striiformis f. sp. tritici]